MFGKTQRTKVQCLIPPTLTMLNCSETHNEKTFNTKSLAPNHVGQSKCSRLRETTKNVQYYISPLLTIARKTQRKNAPTNSPASHHVHHFLALLQLSLRTLDEARLGPHGVVVSGARERSTQLGDLARSLVNRHHVAGAHLQTRTKMTKPDGKHTRGNRRVV